MTISSASQTWTIQFCNPPPTELRKGHKPTMGIAVRVTTQGPPFICARNPSVFVWLHDKASGRRVPELQGTTTQQILSRDADAANGVSFFDDLSILRNGAYELRFQVMYLNAADMLAPGSNILTWHVAVTDTAPVQQTGCEFSKSKNVFLGSLT